MLDLVGLSEKADRPMRGFSGGERQRLGIAQAQINDPELLILDEPAAALDPMGRQAVLRIMEQLRERATIFYSTHILDDVQRVSDRVVILNRGELIAQGPVQALLAGDQGAVYNIVTQGDTEPPASACLDSRGSRTWNLMWRSTGTRWTVAVSDTEAAQARLLRLVMQDEWIEVIEYGRHELELEEIFMRLVQENER
jgi:ABC-2 type transport system ATP-binding protein